MIRLHFTFGPVQIFVAQARRTRDLYSWIAVAFASCNGVNAGGSRRKNHPPPFRKN